MSKKDRSKLDDIDRAVLALAYTLEAYGLNPAEIEADLHKRVTKALGVYRVAPQPTVNFIS